VVGGPRGQAGDEEEVVFRFLQLRGAAEEGWWGRGPRGQAGDKENVALQKRRGAAEDGWWGWAEMSDRGRGGIGWFVRRSKSSDWCWCCYQLLR